MGIFDDVVVNAKSAAQTVGKMAGQCVDMSKLRSNMSELNGEITKRYQELGRFIYEAKKAGSADEAELANQIAGIDDLYAQLSAVSAQYASMQDKVTCPACGKKMPTDSMFCSHCGGPACKDVKPEGKRCPLFPFLSPRNFFETEGFYGAKTARGARTAGISARRVHFNVRRSSGEGHWGVV